MGVYFLDTSALVKRNVQEAGTAWVRNLTRAGTPHDLYIARIAGVEFVAAITRRERGGHLTPAQGAAIIGTSAGGLLNATSSLNSPRPSLTTRPTWHEPTAFAATMPFNSPPPRPSTGRDSPVT